MHTILKSEAMAVGITDIRGAVEKFANEYRIWLGHMVRVNSDENAKEEDPIKKFIAYKKPEAHHMIESAVNVNGDVAYEFVDDTLTLSKKTVEERRQELMDQVTFIENQEISKILAPGKIRLYDMREADILKVDNEKRNKVMLDFYNKQEEVDLVKLQKHIDDTRDKKDTAFLDMYKAVKEEARKARMWGAQLHHDIEDLTAEEIFDWKVPSYT